MDPLARKVALRFAAGQVGDLTIVDIDGGNGGTSIKFQESCTDGRPEFSMQVTTTHFGTSLDSELDLPTEWVVDEMIAGLMKVRERMAALRAAGLFSSMYDRDVPTEKMAAARRWRSTRA